MAKIRTATFFEDERGQSLVLVVISIALIIAVAAFAIDAASWFQTRHHAQVAADAAALAGANCMAHGGTVSSCSTGDTAPATIVSDNGFSTEDVQFNVPIDGDITVTVSGTGSDTFASSVGIGSPAISAKAVATWKPAIQNPCQTGSNNCDLFFALSDVCTPSSNYAINLYLSGSSTVDGNIVTNGNLNAAQNGGGQGHWINGSGTWGSGSPCTLSEVAQGSHKNPWSSPPTQASAPLNIPLDYTQDFPACGAAPLAACVNGYPNWCTQTHSGSGTWTPTISTGNIYCDSGSGTSSTPSTWTTGSISVTGGGSPGSFSDSFVGASITYNGGDLSACGYSSSGFNAASCSAPAPAETYNYPIFYAIGSDPTGSDAFIWSDSGNTILSGDIFVPIGTAYIALGGTITMTGFVEANVINASLSGNLTGDGPELDGGDGGPIIPGTDSLIQ